MKNFDKWFKDLAPKVYRANKEKGFWDDPREDWECMALILTEVSEAVEADRKKRFSNKKHVYDLMGIISLGSGFQYLFKSIVKDTHEDELADICIRCLDLAGSKEEVLINGKIGNKQLNYKRTADLNPIDKDNFLAFFYDLCNKSEYMVNNNLVGHLKEICFRILDAYGDVILDHIELKLKYNSMREYKHGKSY